MRAPTVDLRPMFKGRQFNLSGCARTAQPVHPRRRIDAMQEYHRRVGLIAAVLVGLLLSACGTSGGATTAAPAETQAGSSPTDEAPATEELNEPITIMEWSGYEVSENPDFAKPFTDKYGDNLDEVISYNFFADDAEAYSKLQTGVEADLTHPCFSWSSLYVENDLLQPIDTSRLSNYGGILPAFADKGKFNGNTYFIPWDWGYESILVRADLVEKVPESWADLWDPQYAGHVVLWDNAESNYVMTALSLGIDPYNATPEEQTQIKEKLKELIPNLLTYWTDYTEAYQLPTTGDAWLLANTWQDAYRNSIDGGLDVQYIQPSEKRLGWICGYAIPKGVTGAKLDRVYELLDALIAPESMAAMGSYFWYGFSNMEALPLVEKDVVDLMNLDHPETLEERTFFYQPMSEELRQQVTDIWGEVKTSN
jgi:spermidine/putrescine-binding protein